MSILRLKRPTDCSERGKRFKKYIRVIVDAKLVTVSGVFGFILGLIDGFIILAGLSCLVMLPIDWKLFIEAMVAGTVIGSFTRRFHYLERRL